MPRVWVSDYEWFDVTLENGEPTSVIYCRTVWSGDKDHSGSTMMSERVRRAIEHAKRHAQTQMSSLR